MQLASPSLSLSHLRSCTAGSPVQISFAVRRLDLPPSRLPFRLHRGVSRATATTGSSERRSCGRHALLLVTRAPPLAVTVCAPPPALALAGFSVVGVNIN
ncbi:unnamed protein product [Citrullus colocynthis]|uniref:Uncharacterized protein n=1 Tax=Citrullus colocynthis TaxID=252529 RepID=A0ABP0ZAW1_9ROSI